MAKRKMSDSHLYVEPDHGGLSGRDDHPAPLEQMDPPTPAPDPERKLGISMLMKVALASVVLASLIISISCVMRANQLQRQSEELQNQLDDYNERIKRLIRYINKDVDEDYIIQYAREFYDLYFPDEDIYYNDVNE